jgi:oxygen-independent coproporphyrinogen-3 oxidase
VTPIDEDMDLAMYETAIDSLQHAGYEHYEISNFSRPGFACCHNCGTWRNAPYLGIGPGAASYWQGLRRRNLADIEGYLHCIQHQTPPWCEVARPNPVDRTCEAAVLNLRMLVGIEPNEFSQRTGMDFWRTFGPVVRRYLNQGLLQCSDQRIHLTRRALPIANSVLCDFSAL